MGSKSAASMIRRRPIVPDFSSPVAIARMIALKENDVAFAAGVGLNAIRDSVISHTFHAAHAALHQSFRRNAAVVKETRHDLACHQLQERCRCQGSGDERFLKKLESRGGGGPILHVLQLRSGASDVPRDTGDGKGDRRSRLVD
jgi:hypothetical protein